jgi:thiamine-phosphate pyrophosphorylase
MICLVTDRTRLAAGRDASDRLVDLVTWAARAGVDLIQIRERDLDARDLVALVRRCVAVTEGTRARVLVNDRVDVAVAAGASGVHLRGDSLTAAAARSLLPSGAWVGRSVHRVGEIEAVTQGGLDYLIFGTMFDTPSKAQGHPSSTLDQLAAACREASTAPNAQGSPGIPVLAIGGLTVERAPLVRRAGAAGVAGIGLFVPPPGQNGEHFLQTVVASLRRTFDTCEAVS